MDEVTSKTPNLLYDIHVVLRIVRQLRPHSQKTYWEKTFSKPSCISKLITHRRALYPGRVSVEHIEQNCWGPLLNSNSRCQLQTGGVPSKVPKILESWFVGTSMSFLEGSLTTIPVWTVGPFSITCLCITTQLSNSGKGILLENRSFPSKWN